MSTSPITRTLSADAGRMRCQLSYTSNGDTAKTMKLKAIARTSEAIEVPGWATDLNPTGRIIHDLSGYRLRKATVPMMVNHGASVIGEWTRLELQDGNLVAYGVLKSTETGDIASTLMAKLAADLQHEASINFGDEMTIEEYGPGETVFVNGGTCDGPVTVVRRFFIREISICGLGADPHTATTVDDGTDDGSSSGITTFSATVRNRPHELDKNSLTVAGAETVTALEADNRLSAVLPDGFDAGSGGGAGAGGGTGEQDGAVTSPQAPEASEVPTPEAKPAEAEAVEAGEAVEGQGEEQEKQSNGDTPQPVAVSVSTLKAWAEEFGETLAVAYCLEGLDEHQARARFSQHLKTELAKTNELVKQLSQHQANPQVAFIPTDDPQRAFDLKAKEYESRGMTKGEAMFAARLNR